MVKRLLILQKSATDALKIASKRAIKETAEAAGDLVRNNIADKITSISKKNPAKKLQDDDPHEKINRCLTDINKCLTNIFRI